MAASQQRLELAPSSWTGVEEGDWVELFTKKPVMHPIIGPIWVYIRGRNTYRQLPYMEDGSFNTVDEEELSCLRMQ